jgi:hypothetical protein
LAESHFATRDVRAKILHNPPERKVTHRRERSDVHLSFKIHRSFLSRVRFCDVATDTSDRIHSGTRTFKLVFVFVFVFARFRDTLRFASVQARKSCFGPQKRDLLLPQRCR